MLAGSGEGRLPTITIPHRISMAFLSPSIVSGEQSIVQQISNNRGLCGPRIPSTAAFICVGCHTEVVISVEGIL